MFCRCKGEKMPPIHTVHASTRLCHNKQKPRARSSTTSEECVSISRPQNFSIEVKEECVQFFRTCFRQLREDTNDFIRLGMPCSLVEKEYLPVTQFHIALVHKPGFVEDVLKALTHEEASYVLNAMVDYRRTHQPEDCLREYEEKPGSISTTGPSQIGMLGYRALASWQKKNFEERVGYTFQLPLVLAACSGNVDLVKSLLDHGASLLQTDAGGNNIIHCLVEMSLRHPNKAVKMYHAILKLAGNQGLRERLVLAVNDLGQTPLDLTSIRCLPEMVHAIMNTEGIYKFLIQDLGTHSHSLYDVTSQETEKAHNGTSLLHFLSVVTESQLERLDDFKLLEKEPFATWLKVKEKSNLWHTRLWMGMWFFYVFIYLISVIAFGIRKNSLPNFYNIIVLILSGIFLLLEIRALHVDLPYLKMVVCRVRKGDNPITFASGYKVFQNCFIVTMMISHSMSFWNFNCETGLQATLYLHVLNVFFGFMSLMFFTQLSKVMGHYLTVTEKMVQTTLAFLSLCVLIFAAFAISFYLLYIVPHCPTHLNSTLLNITDEEKDDDNPYGVFTGIHNSLYETFLLILAVTAPKSWYFEGSRSPTLSVIMYVMCLIINTLVLLNLLIAIMNERVVDVCRHKQSILKINQLSIYLLMESKRKSDAALFSRFKAVTDWVGIYRHFHCTPDHSNIYLHVVEWCKKC